MPGPHRLSRQVTRWRRGLTLIAVSVTGTQCEARTPAEIETGNGGPASVATVSVNPTSANVTVGQTAQFTATVRDAANNVLSDRPVTWVSSNPGVATVNSSGLATTLAAGTATITASTENRSGSAPLVAAAPPPPSGGSATPKFQDGFETGAPSAAQDGYTWGAMNGHPGQVPVVSQDRAYAGQRSLKFTYGPDAQTAVDDSWSEMRFQLGTYLTEVWVEYMLHIPANFYHRAVAGDNTNNKFLYMWRDNYGSGNGDFIADLEFLASPNPGSSGLWGWSTTSTNGNVENTVNPQVRNLNFIRLDNPSAGAAIPGSWARVRVHNKTSTAPGANNGVQEVWINNTLISQKTNGDFWYPVGSPRYNDATCTFHNFYIMGWSNSGYDVVTNFYVDDFKVYNSNPGW